MQSSNEYECEWCHSPNVTVEKAGGYRLHITCRSCRHEWDTVDMSDFKKKEDKASEDNS